MEEVVRVVYKSDELDMEFNGVLLVLREANDPLKRTEEEVYDGSKDFFINTLVKQENINASAKSKRIASTWRNKLPQWLESIGITENACVGNMAFANVKYTGGGAVATNDYWNMGAENWIKRVEAFISEVNPTTVFVLPEIFSAFEHKYNAEITQKDNCGFEYAVGNRKRRMQINGIWYYEIYHPSYAGSYLKKK